MPPESSVNSHRNEKDLVFMEHVAGIAAICAALFVAVWLLAASFRLDGSEDVKADDQSAPNSRDVRVIAMGAVVFLAIVLAYAIRSIYM